MLFVSPMVIPTQDPFEILACLSLFWRDVDLIHFRSVDAALFQTLGVSPEMLSEVERVQEWCRDRGARILHPSHQLYPVEFFSLEKPPLFLTMIGEAAWVNHLCLSVVGSREPSRRSLEWMNSELSDFLARTPVAVVSGGARGVDQKAHAVCIRSKRPTVVFLPSGCAHPYPRELEDWQAEVVATGGAILSEFHPRQTIRKRNFERRNRMIAALGRLLLVVEARRRSGSLMTARLAREISRAVCALPSFPDEAQAAGSLDLLYDGAQIIRDAHDLRTCFDLSAVSVNVEGSTSRRS